MTSERYNIGKIAVSKTNLVSALSTIEDALTNKKLGYICVTNARTAHLANRIPFYCQIQNNSLLTVPDGVPLVWIAHNEGINGVGRVSGKDLMDSLFEISQIKGYSHYFFGSTPQTISLLSNTLREKYPGLDIKGAVSPPFQPLEKFPINLIANELNRLKPTFYWCGLGAPKQEQLIALLQPHLDSTICVGVGLAFEYIAGTVKRAPRWMQQSGIEWSYRLFQQPKNISRAIRPLSWILIKLINSFFKSKKNV